MVVQLPPNSTGTVLDTATVAGKDRQIVTLGDPTTAANVAAVVAKGVQGGFALATHALKDSGRTAVVLSAAGVTSVTAAALMTLTIFKAGATTTATNYTVTAGKTFVLQAIQFGVRFATPSTTVTFASTTFVLRYVTTGTVTATSAIMHQDSKLAASNTPTPNSDLPIPDGLELPAGYNFGVTHLASAATLLEDVLIVGYEY